MCRVRNSTVGFLKLNVYGHPSDAVLDPGTVVQRVEEEFPETTVLPGDQLARSAERAQALGAADQVVDTLRRNSTLYGPAYAFEIPIREGEVLRGRARRHDVTFLFDKPLPEELRQRLLAFLRSFGVGKIEASTETRGMEVLFDLGGNV
jgi:hypothetical protein